uniref:5'-nucleotidase domain-containing protein 1 n=1 Tax=Glossina brevipalpis TaxID=37001 RepID=A0A1A9WLH5_9MUSC
MSRSADFSIMDYDIIGFDLDGTLLRYNLNFMVPLEYKILTNYLVKVKGYPKCLVEKPFNTNFLQKGLIIDAERGNLLKLAADGSILRATHGTKLLSAEDLEKFYGKSRQWDLAQEFIKDPLSTWNGPAAEKLRTLLDYFDLAAALVFAQAVDILDEQGEERNYKIWPDILSALIHMYSREHFASGNSDYFESLKAQPQLYLMRTNENVIKWIKELRAAGKAVYLLTGSNIDFANFTASYALGPDWRDLFDCTLCFAKKPGFFGMKRPFLRVADLAEIPKSEIPLNDYLQLGGTYSQGNFRQLLNTFNKLLIHKPLNEIRSLYVGDNLIQDVYAPASYCNIATIALSEELLCRENNYDFKSIVQSEFWGPYFSVDGSPTLWYRIIENYSQLCIPDLDTLTKIPISDKILYKTGTAFLSNLPNTLMV